MIETYLKNWQTQLFVRNLNFVSLTNNNNNNSTYIAPFLQYSKALYNKICNTDKNMVKHLQLKTANTQW